MEIVNGTKSPVEVTQATAKNRKQYAVVVAKSTYSFPKENDQALSLAEEQIPVFDADLYVGEEGETDALFESDWVYYKHRCDIVVKGSAHAPLGHEVSSLNVAFRVANCQKQLSVIGDRVWRSNGSSLQLSQATRFSSMPILYSRSYGGSWQADGANEDFADSFADNPLGSGFAQKQHKPYLNGKTAPNIASTIQDFEKKQFKPVAFGPIGRGWPQRAQYAGTYDQHWIDNVFPLWPDDFDERFFQAVPEDQQVDYLQGGETVELWNMHPKRRHIRFQLPSKLELPAVAVLKKNRQQRVLKPVVDTLNIDVDAGTVSVVWRATLPIKRSLREIQTIATGSVCKRWWKSQVYGTQDCGCGGNEANDEDLMPVNKALKK